MTEHQPEKQLAVMPAAAAPQAAREDPLLGLRPNWIERYYRRAAQLEQEAAGAGNAAQAREYRLLADMIRIADSLEDVMRGYKKDKKLCKQVVALKAVETTHGTVLDILESHGVHQVETLGKAYDEVQFMGVGIPNPWEVVGTVKGGAHEKRVREVIRPVWVRAVEKKVVLLRRGQVMY